MAQETIVFTQGGELPADLLTQAQAMKPPGFTLHVLPADASAEDIAAAIAGGGVPYGICALPAG